MKIAFSLCAALALGGCVSTMVDDVHAVKPASFPTPGIYSGAVSNGTLTYVIGADGRGLSCFRNALSGRMFFGDVAYDGAKLVTQDGTMQVDSVTADEMRLHAYMMNAVLHRIDTPPTVCREFFDKR
jgi:hypothetical protein